MVFSMTGFGRAQQQLNGKDITVEIKSVNSRYIEYSSRLPRGLAYLDDSVKKAVCAQVSRGKVELQLWLQNQEQGLGLVAANLPVARAYYEALADISSDLRIENNVSASDLARFPEVFVLQRSCIDETQLQADVLLVVEECLKQYGGMRMAEGEKLQNDVKTRCKALELLLDEVQKASQGHVGKHMQRLSERMQEILKDKNIDEARILAEAAIFADKTAVDEEIVRLQSHINQFKEMLAGAGPHGRRLDFLTQEINREINTIGSKSQEIGLTRLVVDMKAETEKIREQVQNIE